MVAGHIVWLTVARAGGSIPARMPFAYFERLSRRQQGIYLRSEKIAQVALPIVDDGILTCLGLTGSLANRNDRKRAQEGIVTAKIHARSVRGNCA